MNFNKSYQAFERAQNIFPSGVNSYQQSFKSVGGFPISISSKKGACFTDTDGNSFIDLCNDYGASVLGYGNQEVLEAIKMQLDQSFSTATPSEIQLALGNFIVENIPNIEKIRFTASGFQACSDALELSKIFTNKSKIIVFEGSVHKYLATLANHQSDIFTVSYNDFEEVENVFRHHSSEIAAIIAEPVASQMGCILPENDFLKNLKNLCNQYKSLLILDETKTGFRLAFGGAQQIFNVEADLTVYGSIVGGGFSIGAFGGRCEIMDMLSEKGNFHLANDPSENLLAYTAGLKTLEIIKNNPKFYYKLNSKAEYLDFEIGKILNEKNIVHCINRKGSMMSIFFQISSVSNFSEAKQSNFALFNNFFLQLLQQRIYLPPNAFQAWFISAAISEKEMEKFLEAVLKFQY